jgi:hypothetical protein
MEASELFDSATPMAGDLQAGLAQVSLNQQIKFKLYGRVVLPLDRFVFWVAAPLLKQKPFQPNGLITAPQLSDEEMEDCAFIAKCSLHYTTDFRQEETENYAANRVVFTTNKEVQELNEVAPDTMWIAEFDGFKFGFSSSSMRYRQAGLWHYAGFALYPDMATQVVDDITQFSSDLVVSNSLPAWLQIAGYRPPWAFWGPLPQLFPSFAVPDNERPPFGAVHVNPDATRALASAPTIASDSSSHTQLVTDTVRITLFGARNQMVMDFIDAVYRYSSDTGVIGLMNMPVPRDEKRTQSEMRTLAIKKTIDFEISYLQGTMRKVATQVIKTAVPQMYLAGKPINPPEPEVITE